MRSSYDLPGFLIIDRLYDDGGPVAQSVLNSSGGATGFASLPYPGDTLVNAPGLITVATGRTFPSYPLYVIADGALTPSAHASDPSGTTDLAATASDQKVTAKAKGNGPQNGAVNTSGSVSDTSVVIGSNGGMTSTADTVTRGIDLGVLKVGEVHVHSVTTLMPADKKPTTKTTTEIVGASVAGQAVTVTRDGITLAGKPQGAPYKPMLDNLNEVLTKAGIHVALVGDTPVKGGQSSGGLEIVQKGALPVPGSPVGTSDTVIGNAMSMILGGSDALSAGTAPPLSGGSVTPTVGGAGNAAPLNSGHLPIAAPAAGSVSGPVVAGSPSGAPATPIIAAANPQGASLLAANLGSEFGFFYLVIALGAGVALTSSMLWRAKGVRAQWI